MAVPKSLLTTNCDVYRPFGAGSPTETGIPCRLVPDFVTGSDGTPAWTHYLDLQPESDLRDGCTRTVGTAAIDYADGDEVRVPSGGSTRYVVVWVEVVNRGDRQEFKRAYLLRHAAAWPGP